MPSHLETLLTSVGVPAEDITAVQALKDTDTFDPKPIVEKVSGSFKTKFQNDPTFFDQQTLDKLPVEVKKTIEKEQYGRAAGIVKQKVQKVLGLSDADIANMTTEQREKFEDFLPAALDVWTRQKSGDKNLQEEIIKLRKAHEDAQTEISSTKTKYENEANTKISGALFNAALLGELSTIQGLKISATDIASTASSLLLSKYAFERVGDYGIELRQKDHPNLKALKGNTSQVMTLKDALAEIAAERGWIAAADPDDKKGGGKFKVDNKDGKLSIIPPHLQQAIGNKIAAEK
jgi:hypothetical protein